MKRNIERKWFCFLIFSLLLTPLILIMLTSCGNESSGDSGNNGNSEESEEIETNNVPESTEFFPDVYDEAIETTPAPTLIDKIFLSADGTRYCIAGKGEEGARITVRGALKPNDETKVIDGQFILEVSIEKPSQDIDVQVYAQSSGKNESEPLTVTIEKSERREDKPLCIGKNNHIHFRDTLNDYLGADLFSDTDLTRMQDGAEQLQRKLQDEGLKTKVIIFIAPNHGTIYPETMPSFLDEHKVSDDSKLQQMTRQFSSSSVKFITPYDRLMKEKENYFIYNRTDTHWNELGAYFGYCELFNYISETFPAAKPHPMSDFDIRNEIVRGGDLIPMLPFNQDEYIENAPVVRIKNPVAIDRTSDEIPYQESWFHEFREYDSKDTSKPNILMYRDSFSISMMSYIAETSNKITFNSMWDYNIDVNYVKKINPDFLIIERVERDLGGLQGVLRERNFK